MGTGMDGAAQAKILVGSPCPNCGDTERVVPNAQLVLLEHTEGDLFKQALLVRPQQCRSCGYLWLFCGSPSGPGVAS